jgi:hypothetical protein
MFGMVLSVTWFEFEDLMYDPLDEREPVSVSCNRLTNDSLETKKNKAHTPGNIQETVPYVVGSLLISECISHDCKLDLVTIRGNLIGEQYFRDVLKPVVVTHFDTHPLDVRPVFLDDNTMPHRVRAVTAYLQSEAVTFLPWPVMSPNLNSAEYWNTLGRYVHAVEPHIQNLRQLEAALHQHHIRRLIAGMIW